MEEDRSSKFSPSKLDCYKECPRRYQYRYVDKIARRRKTPETVVGTAVHAAFEEMYGLVSGGKLPSVLDVSALFEGAFEKEWDETVVVKDVRFTRADWMNVGRQCVAQYYEAHQPFTEDRTVAVEKRVGFPITVDGVEYRIEGYVDRLSLSPDGAFEIHDYKTAKSLPNQEYVDADWQLALYELAVRREWPDAQAVRLKWHYVRHGKTLTSVRDEAARERLRADVANTIAAIKHDHEFKPSPGPLCDWCEYRDLCPVFAHVEKVAALPAAQRMQDDGVQLVNALAEVEGKRRLVKDDLKALDVEKEDLDQRLAQFAAKADVTTVAGETAEATIKIKEDIRMPTKTGEPERHAALEHDARQTQLWNEVVRLDTHALIEGVRAKKWPEKMLRTAEALIERFGHREATTVVRLKRRSDVDDQ